MLYSPRKMTFGFDGGLALPRFDGLPAYAAVNAGSDRLNREPFAEVALHVNQAVMFQRDALADGQPQARPVFFWS